MYKVTSGEGSGAAKSHSNIFSVLFCNDEEQQGVLRDTVALLPPAVRVIVLANSVMTNLPATWQTYPIGSRRMGIETIDLCIIDTIKKWHPLRG